MSKNKLFVKNKFFIICTASLFFVILGVVIVRNYICSPDLLYCQEYVAGTGNIKGDVDIEYFSDLSENFEIGANSDGYAVFKDPEAAFKELKEDYALGIDLIKEEFDLASLSQLNYEMYGTYGWQVTTGTEEEQEQAYFVSGFMDIYENSFSEY